MDLYLVRHGETNANTRREYQRPTEPLSSHGAAEVARLVRYIQKLHPTHIYTSDFKRARETAQFFGYATNIEPTWMTTLHEVYPPEHVQGQPHVGAKSAKYLLQWFFNMLDTQSDKRVETRSQFTDRVVSARNHFESHDPEDRIVAVSHTIFINFFIAHLCKEHPINIFQALPLMYKIMRYENSGVTHVRFHGRTEGVRTCPWELVKFNGHAHLDIGE